MFWIGWRETDKYKRWLVSSKAKGSEELVMEFLEDIAEGRVNLEKEGYLSGILGYVVNKKSDTPIPFQSKQDTIEWLTSLAKKLKDGDTITICGKLDYYNGNGRLSLIINNLLDTEGKGELYKLYEDIYAYVCIYIHI